MFDGEFGDELTDERCEIRGALTERWNGERDTLNSVEKVGPKASAADILFERTKSRVDRSNVGFNFLRSADSCEASVLNEPEQLGLHCQGELANFIEKEGAPGRRLDLPTCKLSRSRECAPLVPEQFALEQCFGNGGAVDRGERLCATPRKLVDTPRNHLLAAPALADQTDGHVLPCDLPQQSIEPFHRTGDHHRFEKDVDLTLPMPQGGR